MHQWYRELPCTGGGVDECVRAAFEDVLHDVGGWFLLVRWVGLAVRVRRSGAVVMAVIDGGGLVVFIGVWCWAVQGGVMEIVGGGWVVGRWRVVVYAGLIEGCWCAVGVGRCIVGVDDAPYWGTVGRLALGCAAGGWLGCGGIDGWEVHFHGGL